VRVGDVEMGIDAQSYREESRPVGIVAVEEITVVEVAVGAGERDRLGGLVERVIVALR
jgi:hypothetical protein